MLRWNLATESVDKKMEHVISKTVCGFLNGAASSSSASRLRCEVVGPDKDFETLGGKPNRDGFELFLRRMPDTNMSLPTAGVVKMRFDTLDDEDVCLASISAAGKPASTFTREVSPLFAVRPQPSSARRLTLMRARVSSEAACHSMSYSRNSR